MERSLLKNNSEKKARNSPMLKKQYKKTFKSTIPVWKNDDLLNFLYNTQAKREQNPAKRNPYPPRSL